MLYLTKLPPLLELFVIPLVIEQHPVCLHTLQLRSLAKSSWVSWNSFITETSQTLRCCFSRVQHKSRLFPSHCCCSEPTAIARKCKCIKILLNYATLSLPNYVTQAGKVPDGVFASITLPQLRHTSYVNNPLSTAGNVHLVELPQPDYRQWSIDS